MFRETGIYIYIEASSCSLELIEAEIERNELIYRRQTPPSWLSLVIHPSISNSIIVNNRAVLFYVCNFSSDSVVNFDLNYGFDTRAASIVRLISLAGNSRELFELCCRSNLYSPRPTLFNDSYPSFHYYPVHSEGRKGGTRLRKILLFFFFSLFFFAKNFTEFLNCIKEVSFQKFQNLQ